MKVLLKLKFQKAQRTRLVSQKQKKVPSFHENSLALKMRAIRTYGTS